MRFFRHSRVVLVAAAALLGACASQGDTQVIPPVVLGMLETTPPTYDDGEMKIFESYLPVPLPLRKPADDELSMAPVDPADPYPRAPFHLAGDTRITARFTISNLENTQHTIELLIDPWNEFVRYAPGIVIGDEVTTPNLSGIDRFFVLPALGRIEGIITPDDMVELATDLGTAMNIKKHPPLGTSQFAGPVLYNRAFNVQNRSSEGDAVLGPFFPKVVAGLVGFDLGLRTSEPSKIAVEVILDVEEITSNRVIPAGDDTRRVGRPGNSLVPPPPPVQP